MESFGKSTIFTLVIYLITFIVLFYYYYVYYKLQTGKFHKLVKPPSYYLTLFVYVSSLLLVFATIVYSSFQIKSNEENDENQIVKKTKATSFSLYSVSVGIILACMLVYVDAYSVVYLNLPGIKSVLFVTAYVLFGIGISNVLTNLNN